MATRFYLPSAGDSPLPALAINAAWEHTGAAFYRAPAVTTKSNTALTNFDGIFPDNTTDQMCWGQWVSAALASGHDFTAGETCGVIVSCLEENAAVDAYLYMSVRAVSGDGATVRGNIMASAQVGAQEFPTTVATRGASSACSVLSAQAGDRIVIELGVQGITPSTTYYARMRFGDPTATADFALTQGLTTDLCPWVEFSADLAFVAPPATPDLFLDGLWG